LSAIRFRGGVILQVSCYTLLMRIPTSMATVLLSAPHGTPFRFIGRLEQITLGPAYLESVRLNPSSPVLLTRNGPLRIFDTIRDFLNGIFCGVSLFFKDKEIHCFFLSKIYNRTDLKFERRPRSFKEDPQIPRLIALPWCYS
jgi:hypothetical protein